MFYKMINRKRINYDPDYLSYDYKNNIAWESISSQEARKLVTEDKEMVLIDVRKGSEEADLEKSKIKWYFISPIMGKEKFEEWFESRNLSYET